MTAHSPKSLATVLFALAVDLHNQAGYSLTHAAQVKFQDRVKELETIAGELNSQETWAPEPDASEPVPFPESPAVGPGQTSAEVAGIPVQESTDPQVNTVNVSTVPAPADPQIPAVITPPGEPFPSGEVVVVREGDSPYEVTKPDGTVEKEDAAPEPQPEAEADKPAE